MSHPVAQWIDVTKTYPAARPWAERVRAVAGVTLSIGAGECWGLVGPNRAGKTTLVKLLLSLCRPDRGQVWRLGAPAADRRTLARVGYVHERAAFPAYLTATAVVEYYGVLAGLTPTAARRRGQAGLERVGLADRAREPLHRFSKGMWQRLALAQSLVNDPELWVLDEPSEGLDLEARQLIRELVRERQAAGTAIVLVSHSLAEVARLCQQLAVIRGGRVAFAGSLAELVARAQVAEATADALGELEAAVLPFYQPPTVPC